MQPKILIFSEKKISIFGKKKFFQKIEFFFSKKIENLSWVKKVLQADWTTRRPPNRNFLVFWLIGPEKQQKTKKYAIWRSANTQIGLKNSFRPTQIFHFFEKKKFRFLNFFFSENRKKFFKKNRKLSWIKKSFIGRLDHRKTRKPPISRFFGLLNPIRHGKILYVQHLQGEG